MTYLWQLYPTFARGLMFSYLAPKAVVFLW